MKTRSLGPASNFLALERAHSAFDTSRIVVLPAPYEHTVSYGGGTRRGPAAIIMASQYVEFYDEEMDRELCNEVGIATLPAVDFGKQKHAAALERLEKRITALLEGEKFVVTLGGEHTISLAPVRAHLARWPDLSVLQFDAHSDLRQEYQGSPYSHACVMARIAEVLDPRRIVQIGIRAQCIEESWLIREKGITTVYAHALRADAAGRWEELALSRLSDHVYVTFDVDGFDPSIMPATGTPEPNGLYWSEVMRFLRRVGSEKRIVGCDVVELAPMKGLHHPDLTAAKLVYKLMNYAMPPGGR
jgi:agmatinase